jgi:hypothetical protein
MSITKTIFGVIVVFSVLAVLAGAYMAVCWLFGINPLSLPDPGTQPIRHMSGRS